MNINGSYKGEDAIGRLMHDFGCKESKDIYYSELLKGVKHFKEEGGREIMSEAVENYAKSYAESYAESKRMDVLYESVRNLMKTTKWSAEQAMSAIEVSETDRAILQKRLQGEERNPWRVKQLWQRFRAFLRRTKDGNRNI